MFVGMLPLGIALLAPSTPPLFYPAWQPRCGGLRCGEGDELGGAVANTFGEVFASFFKPNAEKQAEIDRAYAEQLEVAERRRNPAAYRKKIQQTEERRARESEAFKEKFAWQQGKNPLEEFLKRKKEGKIPKLGYEDEPKGGIPLPSASFGVGGEFGVGGKFDNGMRFDLRLPFADQGWVDEKDLAAQKTRGRGSSRLGSGSTADKKKAEAARKAAKAKQSQPTAADAGVDDDAPWYAKLAYQLGKGSK